MRRTWSIPIGLGVAMIVTTACTDPAPSHVDAVDVDATAPDPLPTDACVARAPNHPHVHGREYVFVIDRLTIDYESSPTITGFDLDGRYSDGSDPHGCGRADAFPAFHDQPNCTSVAADGTCVDPPGSNCTMGNPSCHGGVDNSLVQLAEGGSQFSDPHSDIAAAVASNRLVDLIRLDNVDDEEEDASVDVYVHRGFATFDSDCRQVLPDRIYSIGRASLLSDGRSLDDAVFHTIGSIRRGRLFVATCLDSTAPGFGYPWQAYRGAIDGNAHALHLAFDVHADRLDHGALGGIVRGDEMLAEVARIAPDYAQVVTPILEGIVDVELDGICFDRTTTPERFGGFSFGFGLHAVRAVISPITPIADEAAPGTCAGPRLPVEPIDAFDAVAPPSDVPPARCFFPDGGSGLPDFASDRDNCGGCGYACCDGQQCISGHCDPGCATGETVCVIEPSGGRCSTVCADLRSNPNHCGRCGLACPAGSVCVDLMCR